MIRIFRYALALWIAMLAATPSGAQDAELTYDLVIRGGTVYDGSGTEPIVADVAINADTIAAIGDLGEAQGRGEIDAEGLGRRPWLYQHAELGYRVADRRRALAKRHPAGRDARSLWRGLVDGTAE